MSPFESSEKKCTVIMSEGSEDLRSLDRVFWEQMVEACSATIISSIHNDVCDSYVLSESSLFVWSNQLLIITCGQTKLVESILFLFDRLGVCSVEQLLFQRKNERVLSQQASSFSQDVEQIEEVIKGVRTNYGTPSSVTDLFHLDTKFIQQKPVFELLMYEISQEASEFFTQSDLQCHHIRKRLKMNDYLQGWMIDDHVFTPCGYSLNALKDDWYCTIHLTPELGSSYVSFETNAPLVGLLHSLLDVLRPDSFDWGQYQSGNLEKVSIIPDGYTIRYEQIITTDCGYLVYFQDWAQCG